MNTINLQLNKDFVDTLYCLLIDELIHLKKLVINNVGDNKINKNTIKEIKEIIKIIDLSYKEQIGTKITI